MPPARAATAFTAGFLLLLLLSSVADGVTDSSLIACPNATDYLRQGAMLSLRPPVVPAKRCRCDEVDNARRVCPVRRCRHTDPRLLQPDYFSEHCVSDQPAAHQVSLLEFYCRDTLVELDVYVESVGERCGNFSVYRRSRIAVGSCGLEAFRDKSHFMHKPILQRLAGNCG